MKSLQFVKALSAISALAIAAINVIAVVLSMRLGGVVSKKQSDGYLNDPSRMHTEDYLLWLQNTKPSGDNPYFVDIGAASLYFLSVAVVALIASLLGLCGSLLLHQPLAVVRLLFVCALVVWASVVTVWKFNLHNQYDFQWADSVVTKFVSTRVGIDNGTDIFMQMQIQLHCCGANSYKDFMRSGSYSRRLENGSCVPASCCRLAAETGSRYANEPLCQVEACTDVPSGGPDGPFLLTTPCAGPLWAAFTYGTTCSLLYWAKLFPLLTAAVGALDLLAGALMIVLLRRFHNQLQQQINQTRLQIALQPTDNRIK